MTLRESYILRISFAYQGVRLLGWVLIFMVVVVVALVVVVGGNAVSC